LIEALRSPVAYRDPVDRVQVVETHISWVLLTGSLAYKIKKPVALGFVDFSTLERREFYCREELRLNRRLTPELYLRVVPITGTPDSPHVDGIGEPIEFAVEMREFPQDALLSHVLQRQQLSPAHIDALAQEVAEFHGRAAAAAAETPFGTLESIRHSLEELFEGVEVGSQYAAAIQQLHQWCREELMNRKDELETRREQGFVRECHGDMHLGNMLLWNDRPVLFDCIEFNEDFRWIDVMSDLAFTVMDLEDRGSPELAHRFLNAYLEHTGDYAGFMVLL
jgi:aminoglycoside phosphotransferase family enzyme